MARQSKLLVIGPTPPPFHGMEMGVDTLLRSAVRDVFDVTHLELADRHAVADAAKLDAHHLVLFAKQWLRCVWLLATSRPRVVYLALSQTTNRFLRDSCFLWPAWLAGARPIVHLHGGAFKTWYESRWFPVRTYVRLIFRMIGKSIVVGDSLRIMFDGLIPEERIAVVPNGVKVSDQWVSRQVPDGARPWRILCLSNLNRMKGTLVLLASIPTILRTRTDVHFIFAGPWSDDGHRQDAVQYMSRHKLEPFVTFTGEVSGSDKEKLFQNADLFIFPGIQPEGQPLVVLEAMAAGLPMIFTNQGCLRETIVDGEAGIEAYTNDPYDLAQKILGLIERPDECLRMGQNALRRCQLLYSEDRHIQRMISVFQEVVEETSAPRPTPLVQNPQGSSSG